MTAVHCSKAILDKRRSITSRVQMTIYTHPLCLRNAFERELKRERGHEETRSNEDTSEMRSNEDLHAFEQDLDAFVLHAERVCVIPCV